MAGPRTRKERVERRPQEKGRAPSSDSTEDEHTRPSLSSLLSPFSCSSEMAAMGRPFHSGRLDLNQRPLRPERSALARLSHAPCCWPYARSGEVECQSRGARIRGGTGNTPYHWASSKAPSAFEGLALGRALRIAPANMISALVVILRLLGSDSTTDTGCPLNSASWASSVISA